MPELKERFRAIDEIDAPELWAEARRRAAAPPRALESPPGAARRVAVGALAFAVFAVAAVFAWDLANPDRRPTPRPPAAVDLAAELPVGWSELPAPPEVRDRAVTVWTGSQLIVWGGSVFDGGGDETPAENGFVFDGSSRSWSELPAGPLSARSDAAGAWTGQELLIWGGYTGACCEPSDPLFLDDGAAFDPATGSWRPLSRAPIDARVPFSVWTGDEFIVWGSRDRSDRERDGAAYDPSTDSWRTIDEAPIEITDGSAVWTGDEMIVFGAALDGNNRAETATDIGAAYDPATDSWRRIPDSTLSPQAATASWAGDEMIAWDYDQASAAYDPVADVWRSLPDVPIPFSECYPHSVAIPGSVLGDFCGRTVLFSTNADRWREITRPEIEGWVVEQATAGSAFLMMAHPLELSEVPNQTFDTKMLAFVPEGPTSGASTAFVPETRRSGRDVSMPVTFPDGSSATLSYPAELDLANLGVHPSSGYVVNDDPHTGYPVYFLYGSSASTDKFVTGDGPVERLTNGAEIWRDGGGDKARPFWIRTVVRSWTVAISIRSVAEARSVLQDLRFDQTAEGFPVMRASGDLALAEKRETENTGAPQLWIGDEEAFSTQIGDPAILLSPDGCGGVVDRISSDRTQASLCRADVLAVVTGAPGFVEAVFTRLSVEDVQRPHAINEPAPFIPESYVVGTETRMPLVFPDGSSATLVFPSELGLDEVGVQPDVTYLFRGRYQGPILFLHGRDAPLEDFVDTGEGSTLVNTSAGDVEVWPAKSDERLQIRAWIRFELETWSVLVPVQDPADVAAITTSLDLRESETGLPYVVATGEAELARGFGEAGGPQLAFGDARPEEDIVSQLDSTVFLGVSDCGGFETEVGTDYGAACLGNGNVFASIYGLRGNGFVARAIEGLTVEDFRAA